MSSTLAFEQRYRLEKTLSTGGMGVVHEAVDQKLRRRVALKVMRTEIARDASSIERFRREARAVAQLAHANIAQVYDVGVDGRGRPFMVMELVSGRDLARVLREDGPLPADRAAAVVAQLCRGLAHAHGRGVVHRDVKPSNILLDGDGRVKIADFGIARMLEHATLTASGEFMGSASYVSPEQVAGDEVGPASDQYSAGVVLYELITGEPPFGPGDTPLAIAARRLHQDVPALSTADPSVPTWLDAVVARATARSPEKRFPDAAAMAHALETRQATEPARVPTLKLEDRGTQTLPSVPAPAVSKERRWGDMVALAAVVLAGLLLGALAGVGAQRLVAGSPSPDPPAAAAADPATPDYALAEEVVGQDGEAVAGLLRQHGYTVEIRHEPSDAATGSIVATDPSPGVPLSSDDVIVLVVAR